MKTPQKNNYQHIAATIEFVQENIKSQPSLDEVAEKIHLSSDQFQHLFTEWAGISPKGFLELIHAKHAQSLLKDKQITLFENPFEINSSNIIRVQDLFIKLEAMTLAEYKNDGEILKITYNFATSPFGMLIIASTSKGICHMAFEEVEEKAVNNLKNRFPNATFEEKSDKIQENALLIFQNDWSKIKEIKLHLKGTEFQLKVWNRLLKIPMGELTTYGKIANEIGNPHASRAVGTAIGSNPIAFLIPCHRVVQSTGVFGGYMWGPTRKTAMIGWEGAKVYPEI